MTEDDTYNFDGISLSRFGVLSHFFSESTIWLSFVFRYLRDEDLMERNEDRSLWDNFQTDNCYKWFFCKVVSILVVDENDDDRQSKAKRAGTALGNAYQHDTRCISRDLTDI